MRDISDDLLPVAAHLKRSTSSLSKARTVADKLWLEHVELVQEAHAKGLSLDQIASLTDVTKGRIWQIIRRNNERTRQ